MEDPHTELDGEEWRPITFEGVTFPPTLMGISVLASILPTILPDEDDELDRWLWSIRTCCGITKQAPADVCHSCAMRARDLMLEHREAVLAGIRSYLGPHGLDPETTFRDWVTALQRIAELAHAAEGECRWSAPGYASDPFGTPEKRQRLLDFLDSQLP